MTNGSNSDSFVSTEHYFASEKKFQDIHNEHKANSWRIGLVCKKDCYYIMLDILKCLEANGYEWKLVSSSYKLKCRKKNEDGNNSENSKSLNILIQVFSVSCYIKMI